MKCLIRIFIFSFLIQASSVFSINHCEKSTEVVEILLKVVKKSDCSVITDNDLLKIKKLEVSNNEIIEIKDKDLLGLKNLDWLIIAGKKIVKISDNALIDQGKLKRLNIGGDADERNTENSNLKEITNNFFHPLKSLDWLSIGDSKLERLPALSPIDLPNLTRLDLNDNNFTVFPTQFICHLKKLKEIEIHANKISELKENEFANCTLNSLKRIMLHDNDMQKIGKNAFKNLPKFENLDLSHNPKFKKLSKSFVGMSKKASVFIMNGSHIIVSD